MDEKDTGRINITGLPENIVSDFGALARARGFSTGKAYFVTLMAEEAARYKEVLKLYLQGQEIDRRLKAARKATPGCIVAATTDDSSN